MIQLADHQRAATVAVLSDYLLEGLHRVVLQMPTGSGKTITAAALASALFGGKTPQFRGRLLFLAHREELLDHAVEDFAHFFPPSYMGIVQGERDIFAAPFIFASVQTLSQPKRLRNVLRSGPFDLIIVDECHHATADTYKRLIGTMKSPETALNHEDTLLVGLTATPLRSDNISLRVVFEQLSYSISILELMTIEPDPWLVDLKGITITLPDLAFSDVTDEDGDFTQAELDKALAASMKSQIRYQSVLDVLNTYPEVGLLQGIYFGANKADAYAFADHANAANIPTAVITGEIAKDEKGELVKRSTIYQRYKAGELQYISNLNVLPEGVDLPTAKVAIIGRHTKFSGRYTQMIGRVVRIHPDDRGKPYAEWRFPCGWVIDLADNEHTVITLPELVGTTEEAIKKGVREAAKEKAASSSFSEEPMTPIYRPGSEVTVAANNVFTSRDWRPRGQDYVHASKFGTYVASHSFGNTYELLFYPKVGNMKRLQKAQPLPQTTGFAEEHIQAAEHREARQVDPGVRSQPISPSEKERLMKPFPFVKNLQLTKGAAQDLWDTLKKPGGLKTFHSQGGRQQWYAKHHPRKIS